MLRHCGRSYERRAWRRNAPTNVVELSIDSRQGRTQLTSRRPERRSGSSSSSNSGSYQRPDETPADRTRSRISMLCQLYRQRLGPGAARVGLQRQSICDDNRPSRRPITAMRNALPSSGRSPLSRSYVRLKLTAFGNGTCPLFHSN